MIHLPLLYNTSTIYYILLTSFFLKRKRKEEISLLINFRIKNVITSLENRLV